MESRLVKYIKLREQRVVIDKCGLSWSLLLRKAHDFHKQISGGNDVPFVGSNGWLSSVLKRNNLKSLKLHGEGGEVSPQKSRIGNEDIPEVIDIEVDEMLERIENNEEEQHHDQEVDEDQQHEDEVDNSSVPTYLEVEEALSILSRYVNRKGGSDEVIKYWNFLSGRIRSERMMKIRSST